MANSESLRMAEFWGPTVMADGSCEKHGGWSREVTAREMPALTSMAIVNMRLGPGVAREMHWHKEAEWAYITAGKARLTVVDAARHVVVDDLFETMRPSAGNALPQSKWQEATGFLGRKGAAAQPKDGRSKAVRVETEVHPTIPPSEEIDDHVLEELDRQEQESVRREEEEAEEW